MRFVGVLLALMLGWLAGSAIPAMFDCGGKLAAWR